MQALIVFVLLGAVACFGATTLQGVVKEPDLKWKVAAPICWTKPTDRCEVNITVENESPNYWQKLLLVSNATFASYNSKTRCSDLSDETKVIWSIDLEPAKFIGYELFLPAMQANESIGEAYFVVTNCNNSGVYFSYLIDLGSHCANNCSAVWGPQSVNVPGSSNTKTIVAIVLIAVLIPVIFGGLIVLFWFVIRPRFFGRSEYQSIRDAPSPTTDRR